jgi:2-succinyl-5-enolpyruvyl-6-hydroxy-3-cyclohexene-1-carboxylate synthase
VDSVTALYRCVGAFVTALARLGLRHVCLCPGSRSTPLALAFAGHGGFRIWVHLDERSAAFFALGLAKASRQAVVLLCTSGTAAANFVPAVVEADAAHVALLVCTADRPPELHHVGANQTIEQRDLYGRHVRLAIDMPLPDGEAATRRYFQHTAARALSACRAAPTGPVHLNFPFREPLIPKDPAPTSEGEAERAAPLTSALVLPAPRMPNQEQVTAVADLIRGAKRGLIVCGGQDDPAFPAAVSQLATKMRFPVLADPLSGVRCGFQHTELILDSYDAILRDTAFSARVAPDVVLRFGAAPTSKPLLQFLERQAACPQVLVTAGDWTDPTLAAAALLAADPTACCQALTAVLGGHQPSMTTTAYTGRGQRADAAARAALAGDSGEFNQPFEGRVFLEVARLLPEGSLLFAGNSMPVRDLDSFFPGSTRDVQFFANRGVSGIDGVVSTALGVAAARQRPAVLLIGDLSFYHDMNGLLAARQYGLGLTIVLINNDGGGIFSFLPQAGLPDHFEQLFGTPHGLDFAPAAALYGAQYTRPTSWDEFGASVQAGLARGGLHIVEVRTDRTVNVAQHRALWQRVAEVLQ